MTDRLIAMPPGNSFNSAETDQYDGLIALWLLRVLCRTSLGRAYLSSRNPSSAIIDYIEAQAPDRNPARGRRVLRKPAQRPDLRALERRLISCERKVRPPQGPLFDNLALLGAALELTKTETDVLAFCVLLKTTPVLLDLSRFCPRLTPDTLLRAVAAALGIPLGEAYRALSQDGGLARSALATLEPGISTCLNDMVRLIYGLSFALGSRHESIDDLLAFCTRKAAPAALSLDDFRHVAEDIELILRYLRQAALDRRQGVNILIHGAPGVGKTELARALAAALGATLFEVCAAAPDGLRLTGNDRFAAYALNQRLLARRGDALIVFDEIEDVLPDRGGFSNRDERPAQNKAWTNRLLEENPVPALWLSNRVWHFDPALMRRFDLVLELRVPPRSVRRQILERSLAGIAVSSAFVERIAADENLSPALAGRAARVVLAAGLKDSREIELHYERVVRAYREASGSFSAMRYPAIDRYAPELLNTSIALQSLGIQLKGHCRGRILLYGPPGSGKTAFAHELARTLERDIVVRRASDLLSPWVGGTEKNLARMFRSATDEHALLLLDEADSFLQARSHAQRLWEITQVNELLTQMEAYEGVFVSATNFIEQLDPAALRRFGLKVRFDFLNPEQRWMAFQRILAEIGGECGTSEADMVKCTLARLGNLTPGDFAAAREQWRILDKAPSAGALLAALEAESGMKPYGSRSIGFTG